MVSDENIKEVLKFIAKDMGDFYEVLGDAADDVPPAYVFSLTDYSPKRKDALKKSLAIANTEEEALQLFESELADKVKKGWQPAWKGVIPLKNKHG